MTIWLFSVFLLGYFLRAPQSARESVEAALYTCAHSLIPSLFPFAVLVGIINGSGLSLAVSRLVGGPVSKLIGVKKEAVSAILLSALGGFPIGAVCTRQLYNGNIITKGEAERLLMFTSTASPAFCIGVIGISLFGDAAFGTKLYFCQLAAALVTAAVTRRKDPQIGTALLAPQKLKSSDLLTDAISTGGMIMLKICSFTVFFAVVGDAVCLIFDAWLGATASAAVASLCELTLACRRCVLLDSPKAKLVCGFAAGYSGLSVHMQTASVMSGSGVSLVKYHAAKTAQGLFCAIATAIFF